jgi:amino acid adenylation domain-containing protein
MIKQEHQAYPKFSGVDGDTIQVNSLIELLRLRAEQQAENLAYTFLLDGEKEVLHYSYGELDNQASRIAVTLQAMKLQGERAVLLYPQGLDYIAAFFGCLYAGVIAVPAYPPKNRRNLPRLQAILTDSQAAIILSTEAIANSSKALFSDAVSKYNANWLLTDKLHFDNPEEWQPPKLNQYSLAFLQYTSGSTGTPKGVMVSHGNLMANQKIMQESASHNSQSTFVGWLPFYHDMGLICNIMQPLYIGAPAILMSPMVFLEKPLRWLKAISDYHAHTSGGPNFAYDLCVQKITQQEKAQLDLSSWQLAFNGSEPINSATLDRFEKAFACCGFRREAFYPCYGLAEATLFVTGAAKSAIPTVKSFNKSRLEEGIASKITQMDAYKQLVGCGIQGSEHQIRIVNPDTQALCAAGHIGEIQVSGPSIAKGYWQNAPETAATFVAESNDANTTIWLRTGDLGFIDGDELFVSGRLKDLIIIRGRNYYPQDIESAAEAVVNCLNPGALAAFAIDSDDGEKLVLLAELKRSHLRQDNYKGEFSAIRSSLVEEIGVQAEAIILLKPGAILKTTSGKIRRSACKEAFENSLLDVVTADYINHKSLQQNSALAQKAGGSQFEATSSKAQSLPEQALLLQALLLASQGDGVHLLAQYLSTKVSVLSGIDQEQIDLSIPVLNLGIDSLKAIELKYAIDDLLQIELPLVLLLEDKSLTTISEHALSLAKQQNDCLPKTQVKEQDLPAKLPCEMPLSHGQQAIWTVCQVEPGTIIYNLPIALGIHSEINPEALRSALRVLLSRHEQLRVGFRLNETMQPVQILLPETKLSVEQVFCDQELERQEQISIAIRQPFDLENGPLLRTLLFSNTKDDHILLFCAHHIVADFRSMVIMLDELKTIYAAQEAEQKAHFQSLTPHYVDYVNWQQAYLKSEQAERAWEYWQQQLAGEIPKLVMPADRSRSRCPSHRGGIETMALDQQTTQKLKALADQYGATLYMVLLSLFKVLLYRYSGQQDIIIGSPVAGRPKSEFANLVGYFVNPVALRSHPSGDKTFIGFLTEIRQLVLTALEYQNYPFSLLVEKLQPEREEGVWPFYQIMFTLQGGVESEIDAYALALGMPDMAIAWSGMKVETISLDYNISQFDLTLMMAETSTGLLASFQYSSELFEKETILRMLGHFQCLLRSVLHNPLTCLAELPFLTVPECHQLVEWNATQSECPQGQFIHQLFEGQAEQSPEATAIVFEGRSLSYQELNAKSNQLAHYLRSKGVGAEVLVALCVERSVEMIVGLLGILKAGGAYVPIDPDYPQDRISFVLEDTQASILLTQEKLIKKLPAVRANVILLDNDWPEIEQFDCQNPSIESQPANLAYIIYTSGSTGRPKGTLVSHSNVICSTLARFSAYQEAVKAYLLLSSFAFDSSVAGIFWTLCQGGCLCLPTETNIKDPSVLRDIIYQNRISHLLTLPSFYALLLKQDSQQLESLKTVIVAGEPCPIELIGEHTFSLPGVNLYNEYGPTEGTVWSSVYLTNGADINQPVSIGKPIENAKLHLLDSHYVPVPIGVQGEIYLGGGGVVRGYLERPGLTAEKFIPDPFGNIGGRLYKTGDLARYRPDGNIEFLGRIDTQVKIRGYRIELGEVEALLVKCPGVREAVVIAREDNPGDKRLVAYIVAEAGQEPTAADLRGQLSTVLADYMVPSAYVTLASFPLTPNGKLDRKALPAPEYQRSPQLVFVEPRDEAEEAVAEIWCEALGIEKMSIYDNFFDLGGHSLSGVQIVSSINALFGIEVPVNIIFEAPTVAEFVDRLAEFQVE